MAPTNRNDIAAAVTTVLQSINGGGDYTFNLSGTGQVEQLELYGPPQSRIRPYVAFHLGARQDIRDGQGADFSQYGQTMDIHLVAVVSGGKDPSTAITAANNMEADLLLAFHGTRGLTTGVNAIYDLSVATETITGDETSGRAQDAYVVMTITTFWART